MSSELMKGQRTPSPSETNEWTTSASPPEINQATASGTSDDYMPPVTSSVATSTHSAQNTQGDSQGYTILVPANVRFQGMNMQLDLQLDQRAFAVAETISKIGRRNQGHNKMGAGTSMYNLMSKQPQQQQQSSDSSSSPTTASTGTSDSTTDDPPLPLSKNMRRKTGGKNPRDLLAEKLKMASRRRQKTGSTESLSSACINGDVIIGNCATSSPQSNNSTYSSSAVDSSSMHHTQLQTVSAVSSSASSLVGHQHVEPNIDSSSNVISVVGQQLSSGGLVTVIDSHPQHHGEFGCADKKSSSRKPFGTCPQPDVAQPRSQPQLASSHSIVASQLNTRCTMTRGSPAMLLVNGHHAGHDVHHEGSSGTTQQVPCSSPSLGVNQTHAALPPSSYTGGHDSTPDRPSTSAAPTPSSTKRPSSSRSKGEAGQQCEFDDPEKPCRQRAISGYKFCIRHILNDPNAPYKPCEHKKKMKKKSDREVNCSNPVRKGQELPYCSTHLILLGIKEPKRKAGSGGGSGAATPASGKTYTSQPQQAADFNSQQQQHPQQQQQQQMYNNQGYACMSDNSGNQSFVGPPSSADLPSDLINLDTPICSSSQSMSNEHMINGFDALPSPTGATAYNNNNNNNASANGVHMQQQQWQQFAPGDGIADANNFNGPVMHPQQQLQHRPQLNNVYYNNNNLAIANGGSGTRSLANSPHQYTQLSSMSVPGSAVGNQDNLNPLAILNSLQSPLPSPLYNQQANNNTNNNSNGSNTNGVGNNLQANSSYAQQNDLNSNLQQHNNNNNSSRSYTNVLSFNQQASTSGQEQVMWQPDGSASGTPNNSSPAPLPPLFNNHHQQQNLYKHNDSVCNQQNTLQRCASVQSTSAQSTAHSSRPSSQMSSSTFCNNTAGNSFNSSTTSFIPQQQQLNIVEQSHWQRQPSTPQSAPPTNMPVPQSPMSMPPMSAPPVPSQAHGANSSELVQSYPELAAKLTAGGNTTMHNSLSTQHSAQVFATNTTIKHEYSVSSQQQPPQSMSTTNNTERNASIDDELASHDGPFLRPESSTCCLSSSTVTTSTPNKSTLASQPQHAINQVHVWQQRNNNQTSATLTSTSTASMVASSSAHLLQAQRSKMNFPPYAAALIARLQQRCRQPNLSSSAGVVESVVMGGKRVIRLRQKQQHVRMIGRYRHIPAVQQMCKMIEDSDFDRGDLFPLGLEPSDSDTESEEDDSGVGSREVERCFANRLLDNSFDNVHEEPNDAPLRIKLYLLKKQLRLERHRLLREARANSVIMPTARRYPNSVGHALVDRQSGKGALDAPNHSRSKLKWKQLRRAVNAQGDNPNYQPSIAKPIVRSQQLYRRSQMRLNELRRCCRPECHAARLPMSNHCRAHVMHNVDQLLFRYCAHTACTRPTLDIGANGNVSLAMCRTHRCALMGSGAITGLDAIGDSSMLMASAAVRKYPSQRPKRRRRAVRRAPTTSTGVGPVPNNTANTSVMSVDDDMDDTDELLSPQSVDMLSAANSTLDASTSSSTVPNSADISIANVLNRSAAADTMDVSLASVAKDFGFEDDQELTDILNHIQPDDAFSSIIGGSDFGGTSVVRCDASVPGTSAANMPNMPLIQDMPVSIASTAVSLSAPLCLPPVGLLPAASLPQAMVPIEMTGGHSWADIEQFLFSEGFQSGTTTSTQQVSSNPTGGYAQSMSNTQSPLMAPYSRMDSS